MEGESKHVFVVVVAAVCFSRHVWNYGEAVNRSLPSPRPTTKMPVVSTGVKELYLCTSLGELNKKAEVKPEKTSTRR